MRNRFLPWSALLVIGLAFVIALYMVKQARSSDPAVCRPYARLATDNIIREVWNRAYYYCMNLSEDHPVPPETWQGMLENFSPVPPKPIERPVVDTGEPPPGEVPASGPLDEKPAVASKPKTKQKIGSSGYARGTAEWNAYCKKYWPASWDAKTGTVIKSGHRRIPCPA